MNRPGRTSALLALVALGAACQVAGPAEPSSPPPSVSNFPPLAGPSRTFAFGGELEYPVVPGTTLSRFVLYDNGAFVLKLERPLLEYRGGYTEANGVIAFSWEGWSRAGPWAATGTLIGDSLAVRYNEVMMLADFEDALYIRQR